MDSERKSSIRKIAGGTEVQKETVQKRFADAFSNPGGQVTYEREKTSLEREIIDGVIFEMNDFLKGYGAKSLPITDKHIRILDENKLSNEERAIFQQRFPSAKGFYRQESQSIWLFASRMNSPLMTAKILAHELIHFHSYNAVVIKKDGEDYAHRLGLAVQDPKVDTTGMPGLNLFNETNEATSEGLVKRFYPRLERIAVLREEYADVAKGQKEVWDDLAYMNVTQIETESGPVFEAEVEAFSYPEYREADSKLFKEILKRHPEQFSSEEQVFDVFARAAVTGDVKRMAMLVESLGRGAFRALARRKTPTGENQRN